MIKCRTCLSFDAFLINMVWLSLQVGANVLNSQWYVNVGKMENGTTLSTPHITMSKQFAFLEAILTAYKLDHWLDLARLPVKMERKKIQCKCIVRTAGWMHLMTLTVSYTHADLLCLQGLWYNFIWVIISHNLFVMSLKLINWVKKKSSKGLRLLYNTGSEEINN